MMERRTAVKDEPQHIKQGRVMVDTLNVAESHYTISADTSEKELGHIKKSINTIKNQILLLCW